METLLVAFDDHDPSIRVIHDGALGGIPDTPLVGAISKVTRDWIGREWREGSRRPFVLLTVE